MPKFTSNAFMAFKEYRETQVTFDKLHIAVKHFVRSVLQSSTTEERVNLVYEACAGQADFVQSFREAAHEFNQEHRMYVKHLSNGFAEDMVEVVSNA